MDLSWGPATDNVGVAQYRIERCQGAGCTIFSEIATTAATSYSNTGLSASTAYSYRVRAEDAVPNLGSYSNVASVTTSAVAPVEPLPALDSFNRPNENPLSDLGRWSNGVVGSGETGLRLVSNVLGGTKTTTCTAWRNNSTARTPRCGHGSRRVPARTTSSACMPAYNSRGRRRTTGTCCVRTSSRVPIRC
ncbi:MAG: fibronectin type III domain-containing protein [Actinomycetota bacterium]